MNTAQGLVSFSPAKGVASLTADEVRCALSAAMGKGVALVHIAYPSVDSRNHKSLESLVSQLSGHGFTETAALVHEEVPYLAFKDLKEALHVYQEIQKDSMAITASLYYAGVTGLQAEATILAAA
jgi:phosphoribulokinase